MTARVCAAAQINAVTYTRAGVRCLAMLLDARLRGNGATPGGFHGKR